MKVGIIGGGATGFFAAINIAERHPTWEVEILEKSNKVLSKVKVSGGGRCNVTNARSKPSELINFYPRGGKSLYQVFEQFTTSDMVNWLAQRGVPTHQEEDLRMFPTTNDSQTIIDCFLNTARKLRVKITKNCGVAKIIQEQEGWSLATSQGNQTFDKLVVASGGSPAVWRMLENIGLNIVPPVPSLFTFNIKDPRIEGLMGISFSDVKIKIIGTKLYEAGPLLITHWGLSGPAVLKLSAWGARELAAKDYKFNITVNYLGEVNSDQARTEIIQLKTNHPKRKVLNYPLFGLPKRFWEQLCTYCDINDEVIFGEFPKKQMNKLIEELTQGFYSVDGKSTFKEEFVTSGGIKLTEVNLSTFESKRFPNLYLAGEVIDIDALTGGFNFQACWSEAWMISQNI
ncbi:MAG: NAD(P)/FAD-dependent oxidoreductase [Marinoscillum sp.]